MITLLTNSRCRHSSSSLAFNNPFRRERVAWIPTELLSNFWQKWSTESLKSRTKQKKLSASAFAYRGEKSNSYSSSVEHKKGKLKSFKDTHVKFAMILPLCKSSSPMKKMHWREQIKLDRIKEKWKTKGKLELWEAPAKKEFVFYMIRYVSGKVQQKCTKYKCHHHHHQDLNPN